MTEQLLAPPRAARHQPADLVTTDRSGLGVAPAALLDGDVAARSRHELADLVARHRWLGDTRFLLVPYHLIGAESLEAAVLGGYVNHVRVAHRRPAACGVPGAGAHRRCRAIRKTVGARPRHHHRR